MSNQYFGGFTCSDVMRGKTAFDMAVALAMRNLSGERLEKWLPAGVPAEISAAMDQVENCGWMDNYGNLGLSLAGGHCVLTIAKESRAECFTLYADVLDFMQPIKVQRGFQRWNADRVNDVAAFDRSTEPKLRMVFSDGSSYFTERVCGGLKENYYFNEEACNCLVKKVLPDCDDEVMIFAEDLTALSKIASPVLYDPEYRGLLINEVLNLRRSNLRAIPEITDDEYVSILRARKDMDSQILTACSQNKKKIRSRVIAEYVLDRLGGISKTRLDDLLGKISVSITTKQNIRNRFKILLAMYPNCLLSQTQHCNPQHVEAVRDALRDGFQQEGLL